MGLYNLDEDGKSPEKKAKDLREGEEGEEDFWVMQNALKIERIKRKIE